MDLIAGKYQVLKKLGEGGTGIVFLVEHVDRERRYALKLLARSLSLDDRAIRRFKQEAEVLERFFHPGSVQLRDFGKTEDGRYYMTTDYCEGMPLKDAISEYGPTRIKDCLECAIQLLDVLGAAHRMGIVHRDVKPENIMVEEPPGSEKVYRLLDFGIAKLREGLDTLNITVEGTTVGTPQYMSPEQAAGEAQLDHRVDLYSCGIVLYELITGHVPFRGENMLQTLLMQSTRAPAPFAEALGLPESLERLVFKALEKDRNRRYRTAEEFLDACVQYLGALPQVLPSAPAPKPQPPQEERETAEHQSIHIPNPALQFKILCLDDDASILSLMKTLLEQQGYQVFPTSNCSGIHDVLFGENVRFMISDVQMPGLPGPKICQMLKESMRDITIVLFSSIDEHELEQAATESRADAWMSKQWKPQQWMETINALVAQKRGMGMRLDQ